LRFCLLTIANLCKYGPEKRGVYITNVRWLGALRFLCGRNDIYIECYIQSPEFCDMDPI